MGYSDVTCHDPRIGRIEWGADHVVTKHASILTGLTVLDNALPLRYATDSDVEVKERGGISTVLPNVTIIAEQSEGTLVGTLPLQQRNYGF